MFDFILPVLDSTVAKLSDWYVLFSLFFGHMLWVWSSHEQPPVFPDVFMFRNLTALAQATPAYLTT